jgi:putative ABC transport system permease protein
MKLLRQVRAFFRREKLDAEMSEEMRAHLELQTAANEKRGMSADDARYAAQRAFGGVEQIKERARDQRRIIWLEQLGQDLRSAVRGLAKNRRFTFLAVAILALGIGVNTALFSVVQGLLLRPFPYARVGEMWVPQLQAVRAGSGVGGLRIGDFLGIAHLPAIAEAMTANPQQATLAGGINPEVLRTVHMSAMAFGFLGVAPLVGRTITPADFRPNGDAQPVVVLSHTFWQRRFNGDPAALGQSITLNEQPYTIIGVMPPRFAWHSGDVWVPLATAQLQQGTNVVVRLKAGVTSEVAAQQIHALLLEEQRKTPNRFPREGFRVQLGNYPDIGGASESVRSSLRLLFFAVGFLLLIACSNVANLQLLRATVRRRELALRLALGATRRRLVRHLLGESVVLSLLGGAGGVMLAWWLTRAMMGWLPPAYVPVEAQVDVNLPVLAFCAALSAGTGIIFGLVPALNGTRLNLNQALKTGGPTTSGGGRMRGGLVIAQVALSSLLLVGALLAIRGFIRASFFDPGFRPERTLMLRVPLTPARYRTTAERNAFTRALLERVEGLPGVVSVAAGTLPGMEGDTVYAIPGFEVPDGARVTVNAVSPGYFSSLGIPLRAGRVLTEQEVAFGDSVALINEAAAKLWSDGLSPVGRTIQINLPAPLRPGPHPAATADGKRNVTIVGIVGDIRENGLGADARPGLFVPYTVRGGTQRLLIVRTQREPLAILASVREQLRALAPGQPLDRPVTWEELQAKETAVPRFNMALFVALAAVALGLAASGIYSVLSYEMAQRTREIGVRIALGAAGQDVMQLVLGGAGRRIGSGCVLGLATSFPLAALARSEVLGLDALEPGLLAIAALVLGATALGACWLPARRAAKVDPVIALRAE